MPKSFVRPSLRINILKSQGEPEPIYERILKWLLSSGRYIIVFVEIIVLAAFVSRFKFDYDLANTKDAINQQIPVIESLKPDERIIRKTQLQLATIKSVRSTTAGYTEVLQKIATQQPLTLKVTNLNMEYKEGVVYLKIAGESKNDNDLSTFVAGLKGDSSFSNVALSNVNLDQSTITFTITGEVEGLR